MSPKLPILCWVGCETSRQYSNERYTWALHKLCPSLSYHAFLLNSDLRLPYILAYKSKNLGQFCPLKIGGWTYMRVTVCQHTCHEILHKADDVSWARDWRTLRPVARRSAAVGHWHVTLICVTAARWMGGRGVECIPCCVIAGRSPTWAWLAHDWHRKWRTVS